MAHPNWAPQSPDLTAYAPQSPDLSAYRPHSPKVEPPWVQNPSDPTCDFGAPWPAYPNQPLHAEFPPPPPQHPSQLHFQQHSEYAPQQHAYPLQQFQNPEFVPMPQIHAQKVEVDQDWTPQDAPLQASTPRGRKPKVEGNGARGSGPAVKREKMDTGGVEVKTKFPTARIKRIMQADEDVGKVAQVTPVVVAKALELFMIRLISASAGVAKSRGSKRILTPHMKAAVMQDEQFDNLREIVSKVPDAPTKAAAADDDDDDTVGDAAPKKRKKSAAGGAKGKKKRVSDDDF